MRWMLPLLLIGCGDAMVRVDPALGDGGAYEVWEDTSRRTRREIFEWGGDSRTAVSDFVFVVDPSVSMQTVIGHVDRGFEALIGTDAFPSKSRVAVLSMLPMREDPSRSHAVASSRGVERRFAHAAHSSVRTFPGMVFLPGVGTPVDAEGIQHFRGATSEEIKAAYTMEGCSAWFAPGEKNVHGEPCMLAHTQAPLVPMGVEAGLVSFHQWVSYSLPERVFRPGAVVNVVFVSDTHEPGVPNLGRKKGTRELADMSPDPVALERMILETQGVAAVRFHAIAPATPCGEPWSELGRTYYRAAEASGGVTADVCEVQDYAPIIRQIAREGAVLEQPVFGLGLPVETIESVHVGGVPAEYRTLAESRAVVVQTTRPTITQEIDITYRYPQGVERPTAPVEPPAAPAGEPQTQASTEAVAPNETPALETRKAAPVSPHGKSVPTALDGAAPLKQATPPG